MVYDKHIFICTNQRTASEKRSCGEAHGLALVAEFKKELRRRELPIKVRANRSGCLGICDFGPTIAVYPEGNFYVNVQLEDVTEIVESDIVQGKKVQRLLLMNHDDITVRQSLDNISLLRLFMLQLKKDFEGAGLDAERIPEVPAGYSGLVDVLTAEVQRLSSKGELGSLLYRVDVSERQLATFLAEGGEPAVRTAEIIIRRVLQKVVTRESMKRHGDQERH